MNNFVIDTPDNFWQIRWLDKYMEGHKGFIAGGCFKNILSGERVKDIDIFFESESDFQEAIDSFNDEKHQKEGWKFKYRNEKACAFQKEGEKVWIDEDFNPRGIRIGFWNGGDDFKSAHWWDYQDCYITISHCDCDDNSLFSDRIKNSIEPELWISLDVVTNYLPNIKQNHL